MLEAWEVNKSKQEVFCPDLSTQITYVRMAQKENLRERSFCEGRTQCSLYPNSVLFLSSLVTL